MVKHQLIWSNWGWFIPPLYSFNGWKRLERANGQCVHTFAWFLASTWMYLYIYILVCDAWCLHRTSMVCVCVPRWFTASNKQAILFLTGPYGSWNDKEYSGFPMILLCDCVLYLPKFRWNTDSLLYIFHHFVCLDYRFCLSQFGGTTHTDYRFCLSLSKFGKKKSQKIPKMILRSFGCPHPPPTREAFPMPW